MWEVILRPAIKFTPLALKALVLTTGPPRKSENFSNYLTAISMSHLPYK